MKRIFVLFFVLLSVFLFAEPAFVGSSEFEITANDNGVFEYDGVFKIAKDQVYLSVEEYISTDNGEVSADYPEVIFGYVIKDFLFKAKLSNYLGADLSYKKNVSDVFLFNPSIYYKHIIIPEVVDDGEYGFAVVVSKGSSFFKPVGFSVEFDGDYVEEWIWLLSFDTSYTIGEEKFIKPYIGVDFDLTNEESEIDAGVKFSFISGIVFDANWVFTDNSYSISATISY